MKAFGKLLVLSSLALLVSCGSEEDIDSTGRNIDSFQDTVSNGRKNCPQRVRIRHADLVKSCRYGQGMTYEETQVCRKKGRKFLNDYPNIRCWTQRLDAAGRPLFSGPNNDVPIPYRITKRKIRRLIRDINY